METTKKERGHRELKVWQRGIELAMEAYRLAKKLPPSERYALASQICRSATSIPANIAEGKGRLYSGDYVRHLSIARGSLMELDTHLEVAVRVGHLDQYETATAVSLIGHIGRMLTRLASVVARAKS